MRRLPAILAFLVLVTSGHAVTIKEAHARFMHEGQFQLVQEFFTGEEATGNRYVARTHDETRSGQYFSLQLDTRLEDLPPNVELILEVISTEDIEPQRYSFVLETHKKPHTRQILLGLTGQDWPNEEQQALAWRILLKSNDLLLQEWKSFLWEMP